LWAATRSKIRNRKKRRIFYTRFSLFALQCVMKAKSMIYSQERRRVNQVGVVATLAAIGGIMLAAVAANGNIGKPKSETPGGGRGKP
jgi:hypothetical protein